MKTIPIHEYKGDFPSILRKAGFTFLYDNSYYYFTAVAKIAGAEYIIGLNVVEGVIPITWEFSPLTEKTAELLEQAIEDEEILKIQLKQQGHDD
ncbi:MAG: hypothetical protein KKG75_02005 [Nanoarchaeota archaeon]|nr:hypothetical protein [Nanoarchaeota archaeon]